MSKTTHSVSPQSCSLPRQRARIRSSLDGVASAVILIGAISACSTAEAPASREHTGVVADREQHSSLEQRIADRLDTLDARSSFHAKHIPSGREISVRPDDLMNTLSVIKIPVMILAYRDAEQGRLDLAARYRLRDEDRRRGSGLLQSFAPGLTPTHRDLINQMIVTSDNTATDIMLDIVGAERVNAFLAEHGYEQTRVNRSTGDLFRRLWEQQDPTSASWSHAEVFERGFPADPESLQRSFLFEGETEEWLGQTTAREMSRLLEALHASEFGAASSSEEMVGVLRRQIYTSRLPRFVRFEDVAVAHKTGDWPPHAGNDVGILFYDGGPAVVSVFVTQNRSPFDDVERTIGWIAQQLVREWS